MPGKGSMGNPNVCVACASIGDEKEVTGFEALESPDQMAHLPAELERELRQAA
jgi:hypothetical protein